MNSISSFFFILLILITLQPHQLLITANGPDLITTTCDHTLYKDLCKTSLQSSGPHTDVNDLAVSSLKLAIKQATEISDHVKELLKTTSEPFMQQCFKDCSDNFADAIEQIEDSLTALNSKGYNDANTWVTAAMDDADSCEEGFIDQPGHKSPFTPMKTYFSQLCSNALAIVNLLLPQTGA